MYRISSDLETASKAEQNVADAKKQDAQNIASTVIQLMDDKKNSKEGNKDVGKNAISNPATLKAMAWLQNTDFQYNFNEQPLNDAQIVSLATLTRVLSDAGYAGTIIVNINFGNFCLESSQANNINSWRLAANDLSAAECKQLKDLNPKFATADYATTTFRNFEHNLAMQHDGRISVAARNNRLGIQLSN